jgi:hypothetical protein
MICNKCHKWIKSRYYGRTPFETPCFLLSCDCTPDEVDTCPKCDSSLGNRKRVGPTGRKTFSIRVDECYRCHTLVPQEPLDDMKARDWLDRFNARVWKDYNKL